jgi:4-hydroxy 2-oxovalerate aldolase
MSQNQALTVLDCTLRDGGYYNDWDFDQTVVESYLEAAASSGVDIVELGFRFMPKAKFLGPYAYTSEQFISTLNIPDELVIGVMINASDYLKSPLGAEAALDTCFVPAAQSRVKLVRIAAHVAEVKSCGVLVAYFAKLGYRVGFNIMQSNSCSDEQLADLVRAIRDFEHVEALYFADSLGNMDDAETIRIINTLRQEWSGPLGFHGHDNMGKGLSNTLTAVAHGVTWLDATVTGMGRGAGNTQIEYLLAELQNRGLKNVNAAPMIDLAVRTFGPMKQHYEWGANIFYYLGAQHKVHPTYVQDMLSQKTFSPNDIALLIELLGQNKGSSYKTKGIDELLTARFQNTTGAWDPKTLFAGKSVLVVAGGPSAKRHWPALEQYIARENPVVVTLNLLDFVPREKVSAIATCHPGRLVPFMSRGVKAPLILPQQSLPAGVVSRLSHCSLLDFGIKIDASALSVEATGCVIPAPLVAPYAICAALAGGASKIALAGFDGFDGRDPRYREMNDIMQKLVATAGTTPIVSLTATHYDIPQRSIYLS